MDKPIDVKDLIKEQVHKKARNCDYLAGWLSGMSGLIVGAPFDAIKTKQQHLNMGFREGAYTVQRTDGYAGFFRGLALPLIVNGAFNLMFYAVYGKALEYFNAPRGVDAWVDAAPKQEGHRPRINDPNFASKSVLHNMGKRHETPTKPGGDLWKCIVSGAIANTALLSVSCPVEVVKTRQQAYGMIAGGALSLGRHLYNVKGAKSLYRGITPLAIRNVGGGIIQCAVYATIMNQLHPADRIHTWMDVWFAGGVAGMLSWWVVAPYDVVKTKLQADEDLSPKYKGTWDCMKKIYSSHGMTGLTRGTMSLSLPIFLVNGTAFFIYNWSFDMCHEHR